MSETKFTPGPWEVKPKEKNVPYLRIRGKSLGRRYKIANVLSVTAEESDEDRETKANAHLIAAAPEMFQTLEDVLDALTDGGLRVLSKEQNDYHVRTIKRILAKALGEI